MMHCLSCRLIFADPMSSGNSEFYKKHIVYRPSDKTTVAQHRKSAAKQANKRLLGMISEGDKVMDIGCGYGAFVSFAVSQGFDAYGVDFNEEHIEAGRFFLGLEERLFIGNIKDLKNGIGQEQKFDLITLFEVIEHIETPQTIIRDIHDILGDGGLLAISCPNEDRWQPTGRIFVDYPPHHLTRWRPSTLRTFLERQGFRHVVTEIESSFSDLLWVTYVNWSAKRQRHGSRINQDANRLNSDSIRSTKMFLLDVVKAVSKPFDLSLKMAGIGTMGMRMIVSKL